MSSLPAIDELTVHAPDALPVQSLVDAGMPIVLRGIARGWSLVRQGMAGPAPAMSALLQYDVGRPVQYSYGGPEIHGRPFYDDGATGLNTQVRRGTLEELLEQIAAHLQDPSPPTFYLASLLLDEHLPGFLADNALDLAACGVVSRPSIWIGNRTIASCHYDAPNNIACCAVGRRRITVLPPEQIHNLYPGPLEPTPGGQVVSMVDFARPDFRRHPRFREALAHARSAVLEPGDAVFIPSMWWHHVEALAPFNVLVNYWWSGAPAYLPTPTLAMYHALWAIRDRPEREKQAWREVFDYYVFGPADRAGEHLPEPARNALGPLDEGRSRQLRAMLINRLNR